MNVLPSKYRTILGAVVVICVASVSTAKSCGDFRKPETHFDGVNEYGFVSYWDQLGEIKLSDGTVLPLIIGFRSDWETLVPSTHLGSGWLFGLLDAHFVQRSENAFDMISIDGYTVPFGRDPKNSSILNGAQGWKAEVKGDAVTVWAECGWKLQFTKGKISGITTPKNRTLEIRRNPDGVAADIIEGTTVLLKVERDGKNNVFCLLVGDKRIGLERVEKPRIQDIRGKNVVAGMDWALGKITTPDGQSKTFDYSVDGKLEPTLRIGGTSTAERKITWNAAMRVVTSDGEWKYDVEPAQIAGQNAAIGRTSSKGAKEFWHYDQAKGKEVVQKLDGTQIITSWFTSGKLAGALRKREEIAEGKTTTTYQASYDEKGNLFREIFENGEINQFSYSESGQKLLQTRLVDGKPSYTVDYNEGRISTVRSKDGRTLQYFYDAKGREVKIMIDGKIHSEKLFAQDGSWEKETVFDEGSVTPSRTFYREFDDQGRASLDKITELSGEYPEISKRYFYNALGHLEKQIDSQQGTILYFDGENGKRIAKLLQ